MEESKEAIVLIPGLELTEKDTYRQKLVLGLTRVAESKRVEPECDCSVSGEKGVRLKIYLRRTTDPEKTIDIYEAYWWGFGFSTRGRFLSSEDDRRWFSVGMKWRRSLDG